MEYIPAKSILTTCKSANNWFGVNYNMNLYKGCCHGCIYCDSRSECYGIEDFDRVRAKKDGLIILEKELAAKRKWGIIGMGAMSDPYNPFEEELNLTGKALELIDKYRFGVAIATKSSLILRDTDKLTAIAKHSPVIIKITITTSDDRLSEIIEPRVCRSSERFHALKELSKAGLFTGILLMPLLPYLEDNWQNIHSIIEKAQQAGVNFIFPGFGMTLRTNQREWYYQKLDELFPGLKEKYIDDFGDNYSCYLPRAKQLNKQFRQECQEKGLIYNMTDIVSTSRMSHGGRQLSLF